MTACGEVYENRRQGCRRYRGASGDYKDSQHPEVKQPPRPSTLLSLSNALFFRGLETMIKRNYLVAGGLFLLAVPVSVMAQSGFDGTWIVDFQAAMPTKVNVWVLKDGMYSCTSCIPAIEVKADGTDQVVAGQPFDTISVEIVDAKTVREVEKKSGEIVSDEKLSLSDDGETATDEFGNWKLTLARVEKAPAGAHGLSGSWKPVKMEAVSERELLVSYKLEGDVFSMSRPTGQSYAAKIGGGDAVYRGDPDVSGVAVKRIGAGSIEETDKKDGKVVGVTTLTLAADGKSMKVVVKDVDGSVNEFVMRKR